MTDKPLFKKIMQVGLVARDVDASVKKQWDEFGIGRGRSIPSIPQWSRT